MGMMPGANISLLPTSTGIDTMGAYAVLALLADPEAAKRRLDELVEEKTAAVAVLDAVRAERKKLETEKAEMRQLMAEANGVKDANRREADVIAFGRADVDARKQAVAKAEADLKERTRNFERFASEQRTAAAAAEATRKDLDAREKAIAAKEADIGRRTEALNNTLAPLLKLAR